MHQMKDFYWSFSKNCLGNKNSKTMDKGTSLNLLIHLELKL